MVALCSKTYFCTGSECKSACKGLNKKQNDLTLDVYLKALETQQSGCGQNKSFQVRNGSVFTYEQIRSSISYFYAKRIVQPDGVSTKPLDL